MKNSKNIVTCLFGLVFIVCSLLISIKTGHDEYYSSIKNDVRNLNTSLLNNTYIAIVEEEKAEELVNQEEDNDKTTVVTKTVENKKVENSSPKVEPASTVVENNPTPVPNESLDGVYVGLKFTGSMTAYGKDCCGSDPARQGITSSGYDLKQSLTYNDPTYGSVRIVASDKNFKLYSIIGVNDPIDGSYKAIVLDRAGSVIGLNKTKKFDLAVESEAYASSNYGVHKNVSFEVLRVGR